MYSTGIRSHFYTGIRSHLSTVSHEVCWMKMGCIQHSALYRSVQLSLILFSIFKRDLIHGTSASLE